MTIKLLPGAIRTGDEVLHSNLSTLKLNGNTLRELCSLANENERKRMRLCAHFSPEDLVHEMFIVHPRNAYVHPHKHMGKTESMLVLQGEVDFFTFDESGIIIEITEMGEVGSGKVFYHRMSESIYHTLLIHSKVLVFLEVTSGPFRREDTVLAPWAPNTEDEKGIKEFFTKLNRYRRII